MKNSLEQLLRDASVDFEVVSAATAGDDFSTIAPFGEETANSLTFINRPNDASLSTLKATSARLCLVEAAWGRDRLAELAGLSCKVYLVERPRLAIAKILRSIERSRARPSAGVHPTAVVAAAARLHPSVEIGAYCVVDACDIGEGSSVGPFTRIHAGTLIGRNVRIHDHCVIGGAGFGFERDVDGTWVGLPHTGRTVIEDDVEIFPFVNVDRATFAETRVRKGAKLDHFAHVSHNCDVGENSLVVAGTMLCGGSRLGAGVWAGVGSIVKEKVRVGDGTTLGLGAVVLKDTAPHAVMAGVPARDIAKRGN